MINQGDIISYLEMCQEEGVNLQRGMNFRLKGKYSVILMSTRHGAPYADRIEEDGKVLIYEGHNILSRTGGEDPKKADQTTNNPGGSLTQNGLFYKAAESYKLDSSKYEFVKVYEKIKSGIWVYNGIFRLVDAWQEEINDRKVYKFKLILSDESKLNTADISLQLNNERLIPASVKLEVWQRDNGRCVKCSSKVNLHFDHIIPYSKGGSSLTADNIQILCAKHNLEKHDRIDS